MSREARLTDEFKLCVRGTPETHDALGRLRNLAARGKAKDIWERRPANAPIANALILWFDRLPRDAQALVLDQAIQLLSDVCDGKEGANPPLGEVASLISPKKRTTNR